ncbi:hypothetical protein [Nocardia sp. CDC160]|uniref:hypothetical protein n=1 Tax=Nocardia sp. CDC160 TaxID=3112166 RepID=UPI002DBFCB7A|nr:hypothetical protein [Nocardia sp. CDC160]MEC3920676.1 hypothetical protein [Nocardia sp. CDC160]
MPSERTLYNHGGFDDMLTAVRNGHLALRGVHDDLTQLRKSLADSLTGSLGATAHALLGGLIQDLDDFNQQIGNWHGGAQQAIENISNADNAAARAL